MFVEAVVFLSAIIGILLALSAFIFHMITRGKGESDVEGAVDAVTDAALEEINKTSQLVLDELNEKYNALLFVYQLMDDKKRELKIFDDASENERVEVANTDLTDTEAAKAVAIEDEPPELDISIGDELEIVYPPEGLNSHPKYGPIRELLDDGLGISEIARKLNMGQGEIQLIIGLSGRAS